MPATIQEILKPTKYRAVDTSTSLQVTSSDMITNGSFASNITGWDAVSVGGGETAPAFDANDGVGSSGCCIIDVEDGGYIGISQNLTFVAGSTYKVTLSAKAASGDSGKVIRVQDMASGVENNMANGTHKYTLSESHQTFSTIWTASSDSTALYIVRDTGTVADWEFFVDDIVVTRMESFGNNNHGQIYSGRGLEFDGVTDYFQSNGGTILTGVNSFADNVPWTFACWMNFNESGLTFFVGNDGTSTPHLGQFNNDTLMFRAQEGAYYSWSTTEKIQFGSWYRVVIVATGTDSTVHCYLNGVEHGTAINKDTKAASTADGVDQLVVSSGTATVHMDRVHGLVTGDTVKMDMDNDTYDEDSVAITVVDTDTFSYTTAKADITIGSIDGSDVGKCYFDFEAEGGSYMPFTGWGAPYESGGNRGHHLDGMMSDGQVWDKAWTASDVTFDYLNPESLALNNSGTSLTESNLKLWYPMQDGHRGQQSYVLDGANTGLGDDLLTNGDMELDSSWENNYLEGGFPVSDANETAQYSTEKSYNGSRSIYISADDANEGVKNVTATPVVGTTYKLSVWIYLVAGDYVEILANSDCFANTLLFQGDGTKGVWQEHFLYGTCNNAGQNITFQVRAGAGATEWYMDNASIRAVNDKHHATTEFLGDEQISDAKNETGFASTDWAVYNIAGGNLTVVSSKLQVVTETDEANEGVQLDNSKVTTPVVGRTYRISAELQQTAGATTPTIHFDYAGTASDSFTITASAVVYTEDIVATNAASDFFIYNASSASATTFKIDDITVKEVGTASGWTDADQQLNIPQTALQSYNQMLWCKASESSNAIVTVADNANLNVDDKDFSLSCWVFPITESDHLPLWRKGGAGSEGYVLDINTSNKISLNMNDGTSNNSYDHLTDAALPSGEWSHVVVTCDRDSATGIRCYLNGELQSANDDPTGENEDISNSTELRMLAFSDADTDSFHGAATEFMLFKDSLLTQAEVNELYNDGKALDGTTHSLFSTKCTAYYRNNGLASWKNLATVAGSGATTTAAADGTVTNGTETLLLPAGVDASRDNQGFLMNRQKTTNSLNLIDEDNSYVDVSTYNGLTFGDASNDSAFSVSAWINVPDLSSLPIIAKSKSSNREWVFAFTSNDELSLYLYDENINKYESMKSDSGFAATDQNSWVNVVATYDGTGGAGASGGITLYRNGTALGMTEVSTATYVAMESLAANVRVGSWEATSTYADGQIDDVLIYSKELSADEVDRNYNAGKRSHR